MKIFAQRCVSMADSSGKVNEIHLLNADLEDIW